MAHISYFLTCVLFFLTGVCGLIYEVVWFKWLQNVFGIGILSVTAVLMSYMLGMAFGGRYLGRYADKTWRPLGIYGCVSILVAVSAILLPEIFQITGRIQNSLYEILLQSRLLAISIRFVSALACLFVPTFLMGGTLPLVAKYASDGKPGKELAGKRLSFLYAVNTAGAAAGTLLTGFILIPRLGLSASSNIASTLNIIVGISALIVSLLCEKRSAEQFPELPSDVKTSSQIWQSSGSYKRLLWAAAIFGFSSMGLQISWNRVLPLIIGSTTYSFSLILTAILVGMTFGALFSSYISINDEDGSVSIAFTIFIGAVVAILLTPVFAKSPQWFFILRTSLNVSFEVFHLIKLMLISSLLFIPSFCFGAAFPSIARRIASLESMGAGVGKVFWWNTLGTVIGVALSGLVVIPVLGVKISMIGFALAGGSYAIFLLFSLPKKHVISLFCSVILLLIVLFAANLPWDQSLLTSGVFRYWRTLTKDELVEKARDIIFFGESLAGTVSVEKKGDHFTLRLDGKPDASTGDYDMATQQLVSFIPMAFASNKARVLVIGLGSGVSVGACLKFKETQQVDVLEVNPEVIEAARFFHDVNGRFWENPKVRIIEEDARNYVSFTSERYDVIIAEPTNLWVNGSGNLFTVETFEHYRRILNPNGIIIQFIHTYEISERLFSVAINSFRKIFPQTSLWMTSSNDIGMLACNAGSMEPLSRIDSLLTNENVRESIESMGIDRRLILLSLNLASERDVEQMIEPSDLNLDDRPVMEFEGPRAFYSNDKIELDVAFHTFTSPASLLMKNYTADKLSLDDWMALGKFWKKWQYGKIALAAYRNACAYFPESVDAHKLAGIELGLTGRWAESCEYFYRAVSISGLEEDYGLLVNAALSADKCDPDILHSYYPRNAMKYIGIWKASFPKSWSPWFEEAYILTEKDPVRALNALLRANEIIRSEGTIITAVEAKLLKLLENRINENLGL